MERFYSAQNWLLGLGLEVNVHKKGYKPSVETVELLLDYFKRPESDADFRIIIGGTAGKGTTTLTCEYFLLQNPKNKVVTLISPHVQVLTERIRINGRYISAEMFADAVFKVKDAAEALQIWPTYYESVVVAGALVAKQTGATHLLAEVGLGGRLDGVNAFRGKRICALTNVGEDHMQYFDNDLSVLASEKAAIANEECVFFVSNSQLQKDVILNTSQFGVQFLDVPQNQTSKAIATEIMLFLEENVDFSAQIPVLPCRWETFSYKNKTIVLDGAHANPRFEYILPKVKDLAKKGDLAIIFGTKKDHGVEKLKDIVDLSAEACFVRSSEDKTSWNPTDLVQKMGKGHAFSSPKEAFAFLTKKSDVSVILVLGLYVSGSIRDLFYPHEEILQRGVSFW